MYIDLYVYRSIYRSIYRDLYLCIAYVYVYICIRSAPLCTRLSSRVLLTPASRAAPRALQLAKYCALYSSKGYAVGIKAQKWMLAVGPTSSPTSSGQPSRLVADGTTSYANQRLAPAGTVLYRIVWSGFPADLCYYEPAKNLGTDLVAAFGEAEVAQAAAEAKEEAICWSWRPPTLLRDRRGWGCSV